MKKALPIIALVLCAQMLSAQQSSLRGEVSVINSKTESPTKTREYVANAQVEEDFGRSQATTTDAAGGFTLPLKGVNEQESITFSVKKEGLEVVNIDALSAVSGQRDLVRIYMAAPRKIAEYRRQYYQIGKTAAEKRLEAQLQKLEKERENLLADKSDEQKRIAELETQRALLEEQRKRIDENARELARRYAPINLDDTAPIYQEAFAFFQQGELEKALQVLEKANYTALAKTILTERDSIAAGKKRLAERDSVQTQRSGEAILGLLLQADLYRAVFALDSVAACYETMLLLDSANFSVLSQYAAFLASLNQHGRAIILYKKALSTAKTDEAKAASLLGLGNAQRAVGNMAPADGAYREALYHFKKLAQKDTLEFAPLLLLTLNNLGNHYRVGKIAHRLDSAETFFRESLLLCREFGKNHPAIFDPYKVLILNNLGRAYYDQKKYFKARDVFEESVSLYERIAAQHPDAIIPDDMLRFIDLNLSLEDQEKEALIFDKFSERLLVRALIVHQTLAQKNPAGFKPIIGITLTNLGNLYENHRKIEKAMKAHSEAVEIYRELAAKNPKRYYVLLAQSLRKLSGLHEKQRDISKAEPLKKEADELELKYRGH
jgi:tetratricopeptide (TPR) repeat protein